MRRLARGWPGAAVALLALVIAGCGATTHQTTGDLAAPASTTSAAQGYASDHFIPPIALRDPPPGALDVVVSLQMDGTTAGTPVMESITLIFTAQDKNVQFTGSERVTCNGKDLPIHTPGASLTLFQGLAEQAAGTTIACEYVAGGANTRFSLRVPGAPAITSPAEGAQVARSKQTLVSWQSDPAAGPVMGVVALAPGSASPKTFATVNRPGSGQATLDTSAFAAVAGSLHLSVDLEPSVTTAGTPFHTIRASGIANVAEDVTWT